MENGAKIYGIYLNNIIKCIPDYSLTMNISSKTVQYHDLVYVSKELDSIFKVDSMLSKDKEDKLVKSYTFLNNKLPTDSKGLLLSEVGMNVVSKEVLKYCGDLLESGKTIDTKELGKLFKDISQDLASVSELSNKLLNDANSYTDDEEDDIDEQDEDDYIDDDYLDYINTENNTYSNKDIGFLDRDTDKTEDIIQKEDEFSINYNNEGTINDKLAVVISKASKQIVSSPTKIKGLKK